MEVGSDTADDRSYEAVSRHGRAGPLESGCAGRECFRADWGKWRREDHGDQGPHEYSSADVGERGSTGGRFAKTFTGRISADRLCFGKPGNAGVDDGRIFPRVSEAFLSDLG